MSETPEDPPAPVEPPSVEPSPAASAPPPVPSPVEAPAEVPTPVAEMPLYWSRITRDRWFFGALAASTGALAVLFSPFLYVLLFAIVLVVVTWPVYQRILDRVKGRRALAAVLTLLLLFVLVFGPIVTLVGVFVRQALVFVADAAQWVDSGGFDRLVAEVQGTLLPSIETWFADAVGWELDVLETITGPIQRAVMSALEGVGSTLPTLINTTVSVSIDAVIFIFAVISLYMEGPKVLTVIKNLNPMDDRYEDQLFTVFRRFANNMVLGSLATGALQGLVSGIGYAIAGVDRVLFLAIVTGVGSFIPLVGTALVWIPVAIWVFATQGWGWALFLVLWSVIVTSSVDNFVKPLFLRGGTNIHPLLIFLGVFGGLSWMGVPGVLVGPVVVAFFLALYTIYVRDFLGKPTVLDQPPPPPSGPKLFRKLQERVLATGEFPRPPPAQAPEPDPESTPTDPGERAEDAKPATPEP